MRFRAHLQLQRPRHRALPLSRQCSLQLFCLFKTWIQGLRPLAHVETRLVATTAQQLTAIPVVRARPRSSVDRTVLAVVLRPNEPSFSRCKDAREWLCTGRASWSKRSARNEKPPPKTRISKHRQQNTLNQNTYESPCEVQDNTLFFTNHLMCEVILCACM